MTIRTMARVTLALLVALLLGACAPETPDTKAAAVTDEDITAIEARLDTVETDLSAASDERSQMEDRLEALSDKLDRALERLREAIEGVRAGSAEASDAAASALANAQAVASDLSVLEERYEYHLRRYHGGGG